MDFFPNRCAGPCFIAPECSVFQAMMHPLAGYLDRLAAIIDRLGCSAVEAAEVYARYLETLEEAS